MTNSQAWNVEHWLRPDEVRQIETYAYWNDREVEREKPWDVSGGDFGPMEEYLKSSGLLAELKAALSTLEATGRCLEGRGADLACGTMWAVPHLLKQRDVEHIHCVEMSAHRLLEIGPKILEHANVSTELVTLCLGDFAKLRLSDGALDFAFLSKAFHHASDPNALLTELKRVLKPGGVVLLIGEEPMTVSVPVLVLKHSVAWLLSLLPGSIQRRLFGRTFRAGGPLWRISSWLPYSPSQGDRHYFAWQYAAMFHRAGFEAREIRSAAGERTGYVLFRE